MQTDTAVDAPMESLQYAKNLFRSRIAAPSPSLLRRVFAVMSIDLSPNVAAFGERSASQGQARQILFEAGDNAVDLRIVKDGDNLSIRGQILGKGFEDSLAVMTIGTEIISTNTSDLGEFSFANLTPGDYSLTIRSSADEIFIDRITLQ